MHIYRTHTHAIEYIHMHMYRAYTLTHTYNTYIDTPNEYNALDVEIDMQEQPTPATEVRERNVGTIQPNQGCVTRTFASKRTLRSRKLDSAVMIRICGMLKEDTGSGGFSILDYAAPFGP